MCSSIEEICSSIDGSFCVSVQLRGLCLEGGRAAELMKQVSSKVVSNSKLLPYDESLVDLLASEEIQGGKLKCKLCEKIIQNKNTRRRVGGHVLKEKLVNVCGFCGLSGCSIGIMCDSGHGKTATQVVSS